MVLILEPGRARLEHAEALHKHVGVAVDEDVGDRGILEERLKRAKAQELVQYVADELFSLRVVKRVILLCEFFGDNVTNLILNLLTRHLLERLEINEVEKALMKLDLEVGVQVPFRERSGVSQCD